MSYELSRLLFEFGRDPKLARRLIDDTEQALDEVGLHNQEERRAVSTMDIAALRRIGVHPLLLMQVATTTGMPLSLFVEALEEPS